jgi:pyruvate/2-oxoglutarate dehydrogenase complex dihydrolipoamide dehydrogenase (E3) component
VQRAARLLPREEPDASEVITSVFRREGITVHIGIQAARVESEPGGNVRLHLTNGDVLAVEKLLVAVGRQPVTTAWTSSRPASDWTSAAASSPISGWPPPRPECTRPGT